MCRNQPVFQTISRIFYTRNLLRRKFLDDNFRHANLCNPCRHQPNQESKFFPLHFPVPKQDVCVQNYELHSSPRIWGLTLKNHHSPRHPVRGY
ncbi:hypothetical protein MICRO80W_270060 [Micrococcus luteus]|nr:hypothetical protein MICRO80W_270060 [Micrococcus luteus]